MASDPGRPNSQTHADTGSPSADVQPQPASTIEPDLNRAPPPPDWKPITLPTPLPGSKPSPPQGGKLTSSPAWELSAVATEFICFILVFTGIGWAIDRYANTGKIGVTVGSLLGILLGGWRLIAGATKAINRK